MHLRNYLNCKCFELPRNFSKKTEDMGLFNKLRNEFIDIIEWLDPTNDTIVHRFDRYQNEIKNGAKLTVRESQVAVFINEGELADVFPPAKQRCPSVSNRVYRRGGDTEDSLLLQGSKYLSWNKTAWFLIGL